MTLNDVIILFCRRMSRSFEFQKFPNRKSFLLSIIVVVVIVMIDVDVDVVVVVVRPFGRLRFEGDLGRRRFSA